MLGTVIGRLLEFAMVVERFDPFHQLQHGDDALAQRVPADLAEPALTASISVWLRSRLGRAFPDQVRH